MNVRTLIAALAGAIIMFIFGWIVFGILLMDFYKANTTEYPRLMNEMPNLFLIFISNLLFSYLLAHIFQVWAGIKTFGKGLSAGLLIGFIIMLGFDLYFIAGMNLFNIKALIVDVIASTVMTGIAGGVIGVVLGYGVKKAE